VNTEWIKDAYDYRNVYILKLE